MTVMIPADPMTLGADLERDALAQTTSIGMVITDRDSLELAVHHRQTIADKVRAVQNFFRDLKQQTDRTHKLVVEREKQILAPLLRVDLALKDAMRLFKDAEDRRRREEELRLAEEARREADIRAAAEASSLERAGHREMAEAVMTEAIATPAPTIVLADQTKVSGVAWKKVWKWRIAGGDTPANRVRTMELIPRMYLMLDERRLDRYADSMKDSAKVPGLEFYCENRPDRR